MFGIMGIGPLEALIVLVMIGVPLCVGAAILIAVLTLARKQGGPVAVAGLENGRDMQVSFHCPNCLKQFSVDASAAGKRAKCPGCSTMLTVPPPPAAPGTIGAGDGTLGGLIPYRNALALWAYYLGIFALIPCTGLPLGIAASILGVGGVRYAKLHPEAKGQAHAWVGLILGVICASVYGLLLMMMLVSAVTAG